MKTKKEEKSRSDEKARFLLVITTLILISFLAFLFNFSEITSQAITNNSYLPGILFFHLGVVIVVIIVILLSFIKINKGKKYRKLL